ncbi:MAG TPA: alpha-amylase family glycosyl hydrolase [Polyangium sp.]|nr:alpha-amylase family glycosyl hydrolase [Polyangium sp.]
MKRTLVASVLGSLVCASLLVGCEDENLNNTSGDGGSGLFGTSSSSGMAGSGGSGGAEMPKSYVRIHYRLQGAGDPKTWGVHFWGAGSTSPMWGSPQIFDKTDDFGAYTDVLITAAEEWLGVIPVLCTNGNCQKDVETSVRFADLTVNVTDPSIAECWITQGQAISTKPPEAAGPAYKVSRPQDFIDMGNGTVRMMFRVAPGSTGKVEYGVAMDMLTSQATWAKTDDINKNGLMISGLTTGTKIYYRISSALDVNGTMLTDQSAVHELTPIAFSEVKDAADWASWGADEIMYQLLVRTFADGGATKTVTNSMAESGIDDTKRDGVGDLVGLRKALPYLKDLGADAIWMTPVFKSKSYHGYDTTDFYDIDPSVGSIKDFVDLTTAAHATGIKIILDLVENHVADVNPWFVAGADPKSPDYAKYHNWFVWSDEYTNMLTDKHPWDASGLIWACKNYQCYHQIFSGSMPELNYRNPEVRAEMKKIAAFWVDLGADGYRLDASKHIDQFDDNNAITLAKHGTHVWWKEFNSYVKKTIVRPMGSAQVILAGENRWDDPATYGNMLPYGSDMDSQFDFPFRSIVSAFVSGQTGASADFVNYTKKLQTDLANPSLGGNPNHFFERFLSNHDLDRPATQLESAGAALDAKLKQAATIVLTMPGMPVIYYGEEFGKKGKRDKFTGMESWERDEFIREPMSWFKTNVFAGDMTTAWNIDYIKTNEANVSLALDYGTTVGPNPDYPFIKFMSADEPASWGAQKDTATSLFNYYKKLISIRKAHAVLTDLAATLTVVTDTADTYEYTLQNGTEKLTVLLNRKSAAAMVTRPAMSTDLISGVQGTTFNVPAFGALVLTNN